MRMILAHAIHHLLELDDVGGILEKEWDVIRRKKVVHVREVQNDFIGGVIQPSKEPYELHIELVAVPTKFNCMLQGTRQS
jgi:hypothetical protein